MMVLVGCASTESPLSAYSDTVLVDALEPAVSAVAPGVGSVSGGDIITITGVSLDAVTEVRFGEELATDVTVVSSTELSVVAPRAFEYQPGTAAVEVVAGTETVPTDAAFAYVWEVKTPVDRQLSYAFRHWDRPDYNLAEYGTFNPVGGDCANFVAQTLIERGWEMTDSWHNRNAGEEWTGAWIHVPTFDNWLRKNKDELGVRELSIDERDLVKVGDIVMFDWNINNSLDHTQIVSDVQVVDGKTVIKMIGHNTDSDWRDFDTTITEDHPGALAYFWSVS